MSIDPSANVEIAFQPAAQGWHIKALSSGGETRRSLIVASGSNTDPLAQSALSAWNGSDVVRIPARSGVLGKRFMRGAGSDWQSVTITAPGAHSQVRINRQLLEPASIWTVTNLDLVHANGPFVLDLMLAHLHPLDRERILARPDRDDAIANLNLVRRLDGHLIGITVPGGTLTITTYDPIAAELTALALADDLRDHGANLTGPWEERVVQRATELELGIQIPDQMHLSLATELPRAARQMIHRASLRIGVTSP